MTAYKYSDDDLARAVSASASIAGVLRELGIRMAGGSHAHISRRIKRLGLSTTHFTGQGHNRGKRLVRLTPDQILTTRLSDSGRPRSNLLRRALLEIGVVHACAACQTSSEWCGSQLVLHVDHIDGDYLNCLADNLRFLCPNCHSQTASFCRKPSARKERTVLH